MPAKPNVLLLSTADAGAGGYIAALRLLHALNESGTVQAKMLVLNKRTADARVTSIAPGTWQQRWAKLKWGLELASLRVQLADGKDLFQFATGSAGVDVIRHPWVQAADVLHLHWINQGFLNMSGLQELATLNKPVVWTLHDQWAFTGGCHYSGTCEGYKTGCGMCPYMTQPATNDLSVKLAVQKQGLAKLLRPYIVPCSEWLAGMARNSTALKDSWIQAIPNPIDSEVFLPIGKQEARNKLGLPNGRKLIVFGAAKLTDPRKGVQLFIDAVQRLPAALDADVVLFGSGEVTLGTQRVVYRLGRVAAADMPALYAAADVFVVSSLQDNLPNTVMEALACGTPVAAFAVGGIPEMVLHQQNGYLASPVPESLAAGIAWVLADGARHAALSSAARKSVLEKFSEEVIAKQYLAVYLSALGAHIQPV